MTTHAITKSTSFDRDEDKLVIGTIFPSYWDTLKHCDKIGLRNGFSVDVNESSYEDLGNHTLKCGQLILACSSGSQPEPSQLSEEISKRRKVISNSDCTWFVQFSKHETLYDDDHLPIVISNKSLTKKLVDCSYIVTGLDLEHVKECQSLLQKANNERNRYKRTYLECNAVTLTERFQDILKVAVTRQLTADLMRAMDIWEDQIQSRISQPPEVVSENSNFLNTSKTKNNTNEMMNINPRYKDVENVSSTRSSGLASSFPRQTSPGNQLLEPHQQPHFGPAPARSHIAPSSQSAPMSLQTRQHVSSHSDQALSLSYKHQTSPNVQSSTYTPQYPYPVQHQQPRRKSTSTYPVHSQRASSPPSESLRVSPQPPAQAAITSYTQDAYPVHQHQQRRYITDESSQVSPQPPMPPAATFSSEPYPMPQRQHRHQLEHQQQQQQQRPATIYPTGPVPSKSPRVSPQPPPGPPPPAVASSHHQPHNPPPQMIHSHPNWKAEALSQKTRLQNLLHLQQKHQDQQQQQQQELFKQQESIQKKQVTPALNVQQKDLLCNLETQEEKDKAAELDLIAQVQAQSKAVAQADDPSFDGDNKKSKRSQAVKNTCSICYNLGHNKNSCPKIKELGLRMPNRMAQQWFDVLPKKLLPKLSQPLLDLLDYSFTHILLHHTCYSLNEDNVQIVIGGTATLFTSNYRRLSNQVPPHIYSYESLNKWIITKTTGHKQNMILFNN